MWTPAGGRDPRVCGPRPARTRTSASIYARPPCSDARRLRDTPHAILKKRPVRHVIHVGARLLLRGAHGVTYTPRARTLRLRTKELGRDPLSSQYKYEPNAAATQKSESCGHRVRRSATQHGWTVREHVEGSRLAAARWGVRTLRYVSSAYASVSESQKHRQPMRTPSPRCSPMTTCGHGAAE